MARMTDVSRTTRSPYRESRLESAQQAGDIYSLYSSGRDSQNSNEVSGDLSIEHKADLHSIQPGDEFNGTAEDPGSYANDHILIEHNDMGDLAAGHNKTRDSALFPPSPSKTPSVCVTPAATTPVTPAHAVAIHVLNSSSHDTNTPDRLSLEYSLGNATISSGASSPVHQSISRLSPRTSDVGPNASQVSVSSSRYPGEEPDAFHVRSTYARLVVEGVYGDGWDEGVERTRGGAASTGNRKTMFLPAKSGSLGEKEREFLSSLDRYGFVDEPLRNRSETRLALVPSAPFSRVPKLPVMSPLSGKPAATPPPPQAMYTGGSDAGPSARIPPSNGSGSDVVVTDRMRRKEQDRVDKWLRMMSVARRDEGGNIVAWRWSSSEGGKHASRIYKGVPDRWRMAAWWTLSEDRARRTSKDAIDLIVDYHRRLDLASPSDVQIDLDVPRTISGHALFKTRFGHGQRALFHVLHVFSQMCDSCGYCQGMGSIAATLLCYYEPERAFTLLVRLHDDYDMHGIFSPGFPGLLESFYVQERLIEHLMPEVYQSFQRHMISSSAWGAKIYITLYVNTLPFNTQLRLWDAMWLDGYDVIIVATIAILWSFRDLLSASNATFESILSLLSSFYVLEDEDAMLRWIRKFLWQRGVREKMTAWRKHWRQLVAEGKSQTALL